VTEAVGRRAPKLVSALSEHSYDAWWQRGAVYQVYPRSFQDSNADGVGDLRGICSRLDYLDWLGVDAVWLSPIFRSPMADFGYDVADYRAVDALFGSLDDLDALVAQLHDRRMRLLLDLVPNHTSSDHEWFLDSRSSRTAAKRDWYIWADARPDGSPPNAWIAAFGGSAWEWDEGSGQYYFHSFLKEQPDLNWSNAAVRRAMFDVMRFWFERGVDGFRIDVVNLLAKRYELVRLPDDVAIDESIFGDPAREGIVLSRQRWAASSAIYGIIRQLRAVADEFDERVLVGETWLPVERLVRFYGRDLGGLHMPFNFQLITLPWTPRAIHRAVTDYEAALPDGAWPNWVVGNHDRSRIATRVGPAQARVAAVLLLTLRGTPTLYYGDEIGMADVPIAPDLQRDPQGLNGGESRDPERTPMRWDGSATGGFTDATPWLPLGAATETLNVASERADPASILSLYARLLELRRAERALAVGDWRDIGHNGSAIAYLRTSGDSAFLVVANLTSSAAPMPEGVRQFAGQVVLSTLDAHAAHRFDSNGVLAGDEALLVQIE
jgi:alpha-glucosidase